MIGDFDEPNDIDDVDEDESDDIVDEEESDDGIALADDDDDIEGESTAEIKVDELVAKIESTDAEELARQREIRKKLDALKEARDDEFGSTYNFNIDEDI